MKFDTKKRLVGFLYYIALIALASYAYLRFGIIAIIVLLVASKLFTRSKKAKELQTKIAGMI